MGDQMNAVAPFDDVCGQTDPGGDHAHAECNQGISLPGAGLQPGQAKGHRPSRGAIDDERATKIQRRNNPERKSLVERNDAGRGEHKRRQCDGGEDDPDAPDAVKDY